MKMPTVKKPLAQIDNTKNVQHVITSLKIFDREIEQNFFLQHILKPSEKPDYDIISISGKKGIGKSILIKLFIEEAHRPDFMNYCLTAVVDEQQATPIDIMGKFAEQLRQTGYPLFIFESELAGYKENSHKLQVERDAAWETFRDKMLTHVADLAENNVPLLNEILGNNVEAFTEVISTESHYHQRLKEAKRREDPVGYLTEVFVKELHELVTTPTSNKVNITNRWWRVKRFIAKLTQHLPWVQQDNIRYPRVILFLDTVEQLAPEAASWLLDHFLKADISSNVVLVIAGQDPIAYFSRGDPQRWLQYHDKKTIHSIPLKSFTKDETRVYLTERGMTDSNQIDRIWELSGGLPLHLRLLTSNSQGEVNPDLDIIANFLSWIPIINQYLVLNISLLSKPFNLNDFAAFTNLPESEDEKKALYQWLISQPFIRSVDDRYSYVELARELFSDHFYQNHRRDYFCTREVLISHYDQLLQKYKEEWDEKAYRLPKWRELTLALAYQLLSLSDEASLIRGIEKMLEVYLYTNQVSEVIKVLRELAQEQSRKENIEAHEITCQLLQYIEADSKSEDFLTAANFLLEKVAHQESFSRKLLGSVYLTRGRASLESSDKQRAFEDFDRAISLDPNNAWAYIERGLAYLMSEDPQKAIKDINHLFEMDFPKELIYLFQGLAYYILGEHRRAIAAFEAFEQAIKLSSNKPVNYGLIILPYLALKEYPTAIAKVSDSIERDPKFAGNYLVRAKIYLEQGEYEQAIQDFSNAINLEPNKVYIFIERGETYKLMGRYKEALADYDQAIALGETQNTALRNDRGLILSYLGRYAEAIESYEGALKDRPGEYIYLYNIAVVMVRWIGFPKAQTYVNTACDALEKVRDIKPVSALYGLGGLKALAGSLDEALDYLQQAVSCGNQAKVNGWARHDIAWLELRNDPRFQLIISKIQ